MAKVEKYSLTWSGPQKTGRVLLDFVGQQTGAGYIDVTSPSELAALGDILRHNNNVEFDPQKGVLTVPYKQIGT